LSILSRDSKTPQTWRSMIAPGNMSLLALSMPNGCPPPEQPFCPASLLAAANAPGNLVCRAEFPNTFYGRSVYPPALYFYHHRAWAEFIFFLPADGMFCVLFEFLNQVPLLFFPKETCISPIPMRIPSRSLCSAGRSDCPVRSSDPPSG